MTIDPKLLDELLVDYKRPEDIIGENGLLKQLTKALFGVGIPAKPNAYSGRNPNSIPG